VRLLIADDHPIFCEGLQAHLTRQGHDVVAVAHDGAQALRLCADLAPAVAILDMEMPVLNGLGAAREIQRTTSTRVVMLTLHHEEQYLLEALRAGVKGYVLKSQAGRDIVEAITAVAAGGTYVSPAVSGALVERFLAGRQEDAASPLSLRESQVLQLVAEGRTTKQIAQALDLSVKTVEAHRTSLMRKLDIHDVAGLVRYAVRRGVVRA
jgi:DNA-binding NarL/FixJ family response regulator